VNEVMTIIVYDRAIDEELIDVLEELDIRYYTKWQNVLGVGRHDPHLGDDVWPGLNNVIMTVVRAEKKDLLLERVKVLQASFASAGLRAFAVPVLGLI
jgi:hypothetical protein